MVYLNTVVYFWQFGDEIPIGQPKAIIIVDLVTQGKEQDQSSIQAS